MHTTHATNNIVEVSRKNVIIFKGIKALSRYIKACSFMHRTEGTHIP